MLEGTVQPQLYDLLLLDLGANDLRGDVATRLQIQYLATTETVSLQQAQGIIYGTGHRLMVALPVRINRQTRTVIFLVDTGSPSSYLCREAVEAFGVENLVQSFSVLINGQRQLINLPPVGSHFTEVNILGTDFLQTNNCTVSINFAEHSFSITMGSVE